MNKQTPTNDSEYWDEAKAQGWIPRGGGKLYFSLIDENGLAELYVYGGAEE